MKKRGQVTLFIIIALVIVVAGALIYSFVPGVRGTFIPLEENPDRYLRDCLEEDLVRIVEKISLQGGSYEPEHHYLYRDQKLEYLCYTNEYYKTCVVQQPMLKSHIESEIKREISPLIDSCLNSLKQDYENRGYDVSLDKGNITVELFPKMILTTINHKIILTKGETITYDSFEIVLNNNLYFLVDIARSIISQEAELGDVETTNYMNNHRNLKVEKINRGDGTTIYILTDRESKKSFQFASKSVAWPQGYGMR